MSTEGPLERGRAAFEGNAWRDAFAELSAAAATQQLAIDDLERLAVAAFMVGDADATADAFARMHRDAKAAGDAASAARAAFWHSAGLMFRGEYAPSMGWLARGNDVLAAGATECAEAAWPLVLENLGAMFSGEVEAVRPKFEEAVAIGRRFDDATAMSLARISLGYCEVMLGNVARGQMILDEAMASVAAGEVAPIFVGFSYCAVIASCNDVFDFRRAREWTAALSRWCDEQQGLGVYRGNCLVHRCEIFQHQGSWADAQQAAEAACDVLAGPPPSDSLGYANIILGDLHRLRGDADAAERFYREASRLGHDPEPGMSLLRLAQGHVGDAATAMRRVLDERQDMSGRSKVLPSAVEVLLVAGDVDAARSAADELARIAASLESPMLSALANHAVGTVLLAEGDARAALSVLRSAATTWRSLGMPYAAARTRVAIGTACDAIGDASTAALEYDAARSAFTELDAAADVARLDVIRGAGSKPAPGGLTAREVEVLRLVASGMTNKAVADELVLSEKTVARHVANIFTKIGVSSRSAATAYAYEHGLV